MPFPTKPPGTIAIDYRSEGGGWTLSVSDKWHRHAGGARLPPKAGLGTGIVEALVKNLQGEIAMGDAGPGTAVTISHHGAPACHDDLSAAV